MKSKNLFWWVLCVFIPLFTLFWQGCQKKMELSDLTTLEGRVLERGSDKPIPNAIVRVRYCEGEILGNISCYTVARDTTDAKGQYQITFKHEKHLYEMAIAAESCDPETANVANGITNKQDIRLDARGWLKIKIKNVSPYNQNDTMWITGEWGGGSHDAFYKGTNIDTIFTKSISGNRFIDIYTYNSRNGNYRQFIDSTYCKAFDTTYFEIKY